MASDVTNKCSVLKIDPKLYCCRVCFDTKYTKGINLVKSSQILELLEYCVGFKVNIQYTSHVLCVKCKNKIKEFEEFKRKCVTAENLWKKYPILNYPHNKTDQDDESQVTTSIKAEQIDKEQECGESNSETIQTEYDDFDTFDEKPSHEIENINQSSVINDKLNTSSNNNEEINHSNVTCDAETKTYRCTKCKKKYNSYLWLLKHVSNEVCKEYLNKNKQGSSIKTDNEYDNPIGCGLCDEEFNCDLKEHLKQHWHNNHLQCELCKYGGKDFAHMIIHRYTHYPNMKLHCIVCDKKGFSMLSLQFHFRSVHLQKPGGYCTVCDQTFIKFKTWKRHHRMHTDSNHLYVCDHCGRKFLYRNEIKAHLIYHSDSRQYVCETCGKGFKRISSLREHIYNLHKARHPVKCGHCNKVYKCKKTLKIHQKNISMEKSFICEVCSKKFHTETTLKHHMFWHTDVRPFGCEVCGSKYKAKSQLVVHMRKHSGALPFTCVNCGKSFASSSQLKRHQSVHTGVRAHKCIQCERSFHTRKLLWEHATQHKNLGGVKLET